MRLQNILKRFSVEELQQAIRYSRMQGKRDKLETEAESLRKQLAKVERKLAALGSNGAVPTGRKTGRRKGFKVSAATRAKMRAAALRRYAGKGKANGSAAGKKGRKPFSAETRAKMAAAAKARWAKAKGSKPAGA